MSQDNKMTPASSPAYPLSLSPAQHRFIQYSLPLLWGAVIALFILNLAMF